jgi:hypothetical protein
VRELQQFGAALCEKQSARHVLCAIFIGSVIAQEFICGCSPCRCKVRRGTRIDEVFKVLV